MLWARAIMPDGRSLAVANLHASAGRPGAAASEVELAAERAVEWAGQDPLLFGGDFNVRPGDDGGLYARLARRHGLEPSPVGGGIDHLLVRGLEVVEAPAPVPPDERDVEGPDGLKLRLSDHAPVVCVLRMR